MTIEASHTAPAGEFFRRPWRLAILLVLALTLLRLSAIFATPLELYPDETQYWLWSRTLDFGYFSKPPMIAWAIWLTTAIGGDSEAWVRFSAPLFHAVAGLAVYGIGKRLYDDRTGLAATAIYMLMPGVALSSSLIATDALLLCFLSLALLAYVGIGRGERRLALAAGLGAALGLAMLSKYAAIYALIGIGLHLGVSREARKDWDVKTAALAVVTFGLVLAPNLIWNATHEFATLGHTAANANFGGKLFNPAGMLGFVAEQFGVFGPVPFGALIGGVALFIWRRRLQPQDLLLLCLTAPPLVVVTAQALISRANANWAASAYVAGAVLAAALLVRWRAWWWLGGGLALQAVITVLLLVVSVDPGVADALGRSNDIKRVRGWEPMTRAIIDRARLEQLNGGLTAVAVDDRFLFNSLSYYGRDYFGGPDAPPLTAWFAGKHAGNQAEATAPLTPAQGGRVLAVSLEGLQSDRIAADFREARTVEIVSQLLSPKCRSKPDEAPERFDHRCRRRATLILGETFQPAPRTD
ncbi:MAG: glycosyltransferase family 39 protein [Caulobacter sp.]|nr:glycosyltransferase family 39 protein [Caulobacter sp.]